MGLIDRFLCAAVLVIFHFLVSYFLAVRSAQSLDLRAGFHHQNFGQSTADYSSSMYCRFHLNLFPLHASLDQEARMDETQLFLLLYQYLFGT